MSDNEKSGARICRYLRSNEMFYAAMGEPIEELGGGDWCEKTRENFGPDGECVGKNHCQSERICYQSY